MNILEGVRPSFLVFWLKNSQIHPRDFTKNNSNISCWGWFVVLELCFLSHCKSLIHLPPSFCCIRIASKRSLVISAVYLWMSWLYLKKMGVQFIWYVLLPGNLEMTNFSHSAASRYGWLSKVLQWHFGQRGLSDLLLLPSNDSASVVSCLRSARPMQMSRISGISSDLSNDTMIFFFFSYLILTSFSLFLIFLRVNVKWDKCSFITHRIIFTVNISAKYLKMVVEKKKISTAYWYYRCLGQVFLFTFMIFFKASVLEFHISAAQNRRFCSISVIWCEKTHIILSL